MKRYHYFLSFFFFIALASVILYPLSKPGYILTLDAVITPEVAFAPLTSSSFMYQNGLAVLNLFIPSYWIEKIILFLIFFLSGWGMYRIVDKNLGFARYFAGIFYAVNPFVYERVMAGHWQFLLGYSIFPFVVNSVKRFFQDATNKSTLLLAFIATLLFNISIHYVLIFIVFFTTFGVVDAYLNQRNKEKITKITKQTILCIIITSVLNANWIVSSVLGISDISQSVKQFTSGDLISFQSVADGRFGILFNLLSGYGFWAEIYHYFILPKDIIIFWPGLSLAILLIFGIGLYSFMKEKSNLPVLFSFMVLFLLSLDISGGIALQTMNQQFFYLYEKFPILYSLREPQKLVGIIMFCFAYFGSSGIGNIIVKIHGKAKFIALGFFILLPVIYTPTVFGGFWGQLKPVDYPDSWKEVNQILNEDKQNFIVLVFPWHQYLSLSFNGNRISTNPAPYFFDKPVLSAQNYETASLTTHDNRFGALHVQGLLSIEKEGVNLLGDNVYEKQSWGEALSPIDVKYIILAKEDDWKSYRFLERSSDLEKVYESDNLILYKNNFWSLPSTEVPEPLETYMEQEIKSLNQY